MGRKAKEAEGRAIGEGAEGAASSTAKGAPAGAASPEEGGPEGSAASAQDAEARPAPAPEEVAILLDRHRVVMPVGINFDASDFPPGTIFRRFYGGEWHEVKIGRQDVPPTRYPGVAQRRCWWRYIYRGKKYKSLSAIAYKITGRRFLSGNRFFGLWRDGCHTWDRRFAVTE